VRSASQTCLQACTAGHTRRSRTVLMSDTRSNSRETDIAHFIE
jgi:hypothetical protein